MAARGGLKSSWLGRGFFRAFVITVGVLVGILIGLGVFTFGYANGFAYFGNNPKTCDSCHAMNPEYNAWQAGSHHNVAGCNDCHAPHDNIVHKYAVKAENGFWHSYKFTANNYPQNIKIRESNRKVTEHACLTCHANLVHDINMTRSENDQVDCLRCHSNVGHRR